MAMKLYPDTAIQDIADAIRSKNGSTDTYTVEQMAQAIENIPSGGGNLGWFTKSASGTVTYASSNNNNTSLIIFDLADIDFTPKTVLCRIQPESLAIIRAAVENTESPLTINKFLFCSYNLITDNNGLNNHIKSTARTYISNGAVGSNVPNGSNAAFTSQTADFIGNNGTSVYFRTTQGFGAYAGTTYDWIALGD